jgi:LasA protease
VFRKMGWLLLPILLVASCAGPGQPEQEAIKSTSVVGTTLPSTAAPVEGEAQQAEQPLPPTAVPTATPVPSVPAMPIPTPDGLPTEIYVVQPGDTLSGIAFYQCGCEMEELAALNGIDDPAALQVGQPLQIPYEVELTGPNELLLPDSEVVFSPAYVDFDLAAYIEQQDGYLKTYREQVNGREQSAAELLQTIAQNFSIGPRVLLALLEYQSGWVTGSPQTDMATRFPMSLGHGGYEGLYYQLGWAADKLNEGYYTYKRSGTVVFKLADGSRVLAATGLDAGTVAVQDVLAATRDQQEWYGALSADGFMATYREMFGDPAELAVEPLVPIDLTQPLLALPWEGEHTWYLSGGPHGAWLDGSAWAAVDFAPPDVKGHCGVSQQWATAAADGLVVRSEEGKVLIDLDGDGYEQTGWVLFYLHVVQPESLVPGVYLKKGDPVGHPSCVGGLGDSSHLHIARRFNGEWIAADGPVPLVLSGWRAVNGIAPYEGSMVRLDETREACECWDDEVNSMVSDNVVLP